MYRCCRCEMTIVGVDTRWLLLPLVPTLYSDKTWHHCGGEALGRAVWWEIYYVSICIIYICISLYVYNIKYYWCFQWYFSHKRQLCIILKMGTLFYNTSESLGERLESKGDPQALLSAMICYVCAGSLEKCVSCWIKTRPSTNKPQDLQVTSIILKLSGYKCMFMSTWFTYIFA